MSDFILSDSDPVAIRIRAAAERDMLFHALLFTGPGNRLAAAQYAAAAFQCKNQNQKIRPCGVCTACHKILSGTHPDVIFIEDPEHKAISLEIIRRNRADAYLRPNEGNRKVYIFPNCELLTPAAQNILLKLVEEGPDYAAFLFCVENSAIVLSTLRSRCVELKTQAFSDLQEHCKVNKSKKIKITESVEKFCRQIATGRPGVISKFAAELEQKKRSREELAELLGRERVLFVSALLFRFDRVLFISRQDLGQDSEQNQELVKLLAESLLSNRQLMYIIKLLEKYRRACDYHAGVGHVLGALAVELEENLW